MARRKKRAAAPKKGTKEATPEQNRKKCETEERLEFNKVRVEVEMGKMTSELKSLGEKMIKNSREAHEMFMERVPAELGNMTMRDFFDAGHMLDYGAPVSGKFVALGPCHYQLSEEAEEAPKRKLPAPRPTLTEVRGVLATVPEVLSTPAPSSGPINTGNMFITPKVVLQPKRGFITVYTDNGSPYQLNLATLRARLPEDPSAASTRVTRSTRTTRATSKRSRRD